MKNIDELDLQELITLQGCVKGIISKYDNKLQTYAVIHNDSYFYEISDSEKEMFDRKKVFGDILNRIDKRIEDYVYENFK